MQGYVNLYTCSRVPFIYLNYIPVLGKVFCMDGWFVKKLASNNAAWLFS